MQLRKQSTNTKNFLTESRIINDEVDQALQIVEGDYNLEE